MKKLMMTGLTAAMISAGAVTAGEVVGYTAPQANQAATAASVDGNFQALIDAINDNNLRIAELESFDVSGKTYEYREIGFILGAQRPEAAPTTQSPGDGSAIFEGFVRIGIFNASGTITFNANDNGMTVNLDEYETELWANPESDIGPASNFQGGIAGTFDTTGTYTQNGAEVSITLIDPESQLAEDPFTVNVNRGANLMTVTNQGIGGQVIVPDQCTNTVPNECVQEWETSFGVATRSN